MLHLTLLAGLLLVTTLLCLRRARVATARLRESEATFHAALETMHDGLVVRDRSGSLFAANAPGLEILGLNRDQLAGLSPSDAGWQAFHEDGTPWPQNEWPSHIALREGLPQKDRVLGVRMPSGETIWLSISAVPLIREGEDRPYRVVATFSDVTVRKRREERTRRQIERVHDANEKLEQANARLAEMARNDGLTGVRNQRAFWEGMGIEIERSRRAGTPLALLMVDVDEFKAYNDALGHPEGDAALRRIATCLASAARATDLVARYGGEEFAVIVPDTDLAGALAFAERLRASVQSAAWPHRPVTVSLGVATLQVDDDAERLVAEADAALYRSKREGRNRVSHAQGDERGSFLIA